MNIFRNIFRFVSNIFSQHLEEWVQVSPCNSACIFPKCPSWHSPGSLYRKGWETYGDRVPANFFEKFRKFWKKNRKFFGFGWGELPPRPLGFGRGGKPPPDHPLKRSSLAFDRGGQTGPPRSNAFFPALFGRPWHLIKVAKPGRLDQMFFVSVPLTIRRP